MSTTVSGSRLSGSSADGAGVEPGTAVRHGLGGLRGRGSVSRLAIGVMLVLASVATFTAITLLRDQSRDVLALTRSVPVGHTLTDADLRTVPVDVGAEIATVPADSAATVLGQRVAYSLPAGSLLSPAALGSPAIPGTGQAVAALALKPGQFPPRLSPGTHVLVVQTATDGGDDQSAESTKSESTNSTDTAWPAVVLDVQSGEPAAVVSILVSRTDAVQIATSADQVSVLEVKGE